MTILPNFKHKDGQISIKSAEEVGNPCRTNRTFYFMLFFKKNEKKDELFLFSFGLSLKKKIHYFQKKFFHQYKKWNVLHFDFQIENIYLLNAILEFFGIELQKKKLENRYNNNNKLLK